MIGAHVNMESIKAELGPRNDQQKIKFLLGMTESLLAEIEWLRSLIEDADARAAGILPGTGEGDAP